MTVPLMMWSARKLMVATACNKEKAIPTTPPTKIAIHGVNDPRLSAMVKLKTTELNAPMIIIPSKPTFTIPLRSEKVPPKAVKIKGVEYTSVDVTINAIKSTADIIDRLLRSEERRVGKECRSR